MPASFCCLVVWADSFPSPTTGGLCLTNGTVAAYTQCEEEEPRLVRLRVGSYRPRRSRRFPNSQRDRGHRRGGLCPAREHRLRAGQRRSVWRQQQQQRGGPQRALRLAGAELVALYGDDQDAEADVANVSGGGVQPSALGVSVSRGACPRILLIQFFSEPCCRGGFATARRLQSCLRDISGACVKATSPQRLLRVCGAVYDE